MNPLTIEYIKCHPEARTPTRAHACDAGLDLYSVESKLNESVQMPVRTGICLSIPSGYVGIIKGRSGLALKHGIDVLAGVVDSGFSGEVVVILSVPASYGFGVNVGDKIAQIVIVKLPEVELKEVEQLPATPRGIKGFGSTDPKLSGDKAD